ncbi:hypothetical protein [Alkalibacterium gilvum]|nr:hypothetical protein [Alkalibacterium gilvum]
MFVASISPSTVLAVSDIEDDGVHKVTEETLEPLEDLNQKELMTLLEIVEKIPSELLVDGKEQELLAYLEEEGIYYKVLEDTELLENGGLVSTMGAWQVTKCVAAIGVVVGGSFIGIGLLMKLKNFIKAVGGIKAAGMALVLIAEQGFTQQTVNALGRSVVAMGSTILGIDQIQQQCS